MKLDFSELVDQGLVKEKLYPEHNLKIVKYSRKVFYDNLWHTHPLLLESRGTVLDLDNNVISLPFRKIFNYGENNTTIDNSEVVTWSQKVNGFMLAVTYHAETNLTLPSTTGSLDSDFIIYGAKMFDKGIHAVAKKYKDYTLLFEICRIADPHIIRQLEGVYLIGGRCKETGELMPETLLDEIAQSFEVFRPPWGTCSFGEIKAACKGRNANTEGFVVYGKDTTLKIKTPYYLTKKFLMRVGTKKIATIFENKQEFLKTLDEEFYGLVEFLNTNFTQQSFQKLSEQERGDVVEFYFNYVEK